MTTPTLREAAQAALMALEQHAMQRTYAGGVYISNAAIALRAALAQPVPDSTCKFPLCQSEEYQTTLAAQIHAELYTGAHPQPAPLTDAQIDAGIEAWFKTDITTNNGADRGHPFRQRMRAAIEAAAGIVPVADVGFTEAEARAGELAFEANDGIVPAPTTGEGQ
jgi:hypothetical protein